MPVKKSAILFFLLSVGSISLLVFSSEIKPAETGIPAKCNPALRCSQMNDPKTFLPFYMISQLVLRSAA